MTWWDILGWFLAFGFTTSLFYRRGVRAGIIHALKKLNLDTYQIEKLNTELKKNNRTLAKETLN